MYYGSVQVAYPISGGVPDMPWDVFHVRWISKLDDGLDYIRVRDVISLTCSDKVTIYLIVRLNWILAWENITIGATEHVT